MTKLDGYTDMTMREKYALYGIKKIGYLDIEATDLDGKFGFMLSWVLEKRDLNTGKSTTVYDIIDKPTIDKELKNRSINFDKDILESLFAEMQDIDLIIGHYFVGKFRFDIPFLRARAIITGAKGFPEHRVIKYADTHKMAKQLYKMRTYGLASVGDLFDVHDKKTPITRHDWVLAKFGDKKALKYILDHNIQDVKITSKVHREMEQYINIPSVYA